MIKALLLPFLAMLIVQVAAFIARSRKGEKEMSQLGRRFRAGLQIGAVVILAAGLFAAYRAYRRAEAEPEAVRNVIALRSGGLRVPGHD